MMKKILAVGLFSGMMLFGNSAFAGTLSNGIKLQGYQMNGFFLNGIIVNGINLQGNQMNGFRFNGIIVNGSLLDSKEITSLDTDTKKNTMQKVELAVDIVKLPNN